MPRTRSHATRQFWFFRVMAAIIISFAIAATAGPNISLAQSQHSDRDQQDKSDKQDAGENSDDEVKQSSRVFQISPDDVLRSGNKPTIRRQTNGETQTVNDRQGRRTIKMRQNDKEGIFVQVTLRYGPENTAELTRKHPDLADYVELFPKQVGDHQIELNLSVKSDYRARTLEELKENHPHAFNLFRRYYKKNAKSQSRRNR